MKNAPQKKENQASESVYPAIYDFSIYPYALGDVLTWNVKNCIKTIQARKKEMDVYLCADRVAPASVHQKQHINENNYQLHLYELLPAFFCNPMLRNIYFYFDRSHFGRVLKNIPITDKITRQSFLEYQQSIEEGYSYYSANKTLKDQISSHEDINRFYANTSYLPKLVAPKGCQEDALDLRKRFGDDAFVVTLNFRIRAFDQKLGVPEPHRDCELGAWADFIKTAQHKFPKVVFLVLGKLQEKPNSLFKLGNVVAPRLCGMNLGHELALILISDLFIGSSSGFAAMANFSDVPYFVTKINEGACRNYGVPLNTKYLPFAQKNQILSYEKETAEVLLGYLTEAYHAKYPEHKINQNPDPSNKPVSWITSTMLGPIPLPEISDETRLYVTSNMQRAQMMINERNETGALQLLDQTYQEHPEAASSTLNFHILRAMLLIKNGKLKEAREAILNELVLQPLNDQVAHFRDMIELAARQKGITLK